MSADEEFEYSIVATWMTAASCWQDVLVTQSDSGRAAAGAGADPVRRLEGAIARLAAQVAGRPPTGRTHDDADDETGTAATDDAVNFNPLPLLRAFHQRGATVAVIGQVAGIMHGSAELTGDLDLLWDGDPRQAPLLARAFADVGAELTDDDGVPRTCDEAAFALPKIQFRSAQACGDCCTLALPWGDLPVAEMLSRCQLATAEQGFTFRYLTRADLIRMRRAVARPKDLRRAAELASQETARTAEIGQPAS